MVKHTNGKKAESKTQEFKKGSSLPFSSFCQIIEKNKVFVSIYTITKRRLSRTWSQALQSDIWWEDDR